jgi:hypothetical protein
MKNKNKNNTQRQAHPRRKQSPKQSKTFSPLDGASCSASSFFSRMWRFITNADKRDTEKEYQESFNREQDRKVKEIMDWFARNSLTDTHDGCKCRNQGANTDNPR